MNAKHELVKKLQFPKSAWQLRKLLYLQGTRNASRIGKHRRGTLIVENITADRDQNSTEITWRRFKDIFGRIRTVAGQRINAYAFAEHNDVLRKLGKFPARLA